MSQNNSPDWIILVLGGGDYLLNTEEYFEMEERRETSFLKIYGILALYSNILGIDIPLSILVMESWASWVGYRTEHIHVMQMIRKESRNCFQEFRTLGNSLDLIPNSYCSVSSSRKGSGSSHYHMWCVLRGGGVFQQIKPLTVLLSFLMAQTQTQA